MSGLPSFQSTAAYFTSIGATKDSAPAARPTSNERRLCRKVTRPISREEAKAKIGEDNADALDEAVKADYVQRMETCLQKRPTYD
jgi:hypothetical protein